MLIFRWESSKRWGDSSQVTLPESMKWDWTQVCLMSEPMLPTPTPPHFLSLGHLRAACTRPTTWGSDSFGRTDCRRSQHTQGLVHKEQRPVLQAWATCYALDISVHPHLFLGFGELPLCGSWKPGQELTWKLQLQQKQTWKELVSESPSMTLSTWLVILLVTAII